VWAVSTRQWESSVLVRGTSMSRRSAERRCARSAMSASGTQQRQTYAETCLFHKSFPPGWLSAVHHSRLVCVRCTSPENRRRIPSGDMHADVGSCRHVFLSSTATATCSWLRLSSVLSSMSPAEVASSFTNRFTLGKVRALAGRPPAGQYD